jgi:hypothetical protein
MNRTILLIAIFFSSNVTGQNYLGETIAKDSALEDFHVFKSALKSGHPGLYWYKSLDEISKSFSDAESQINKDITNKEFHGILTSVMNDLSCGHSIVLYPKEYSLKIDTLPLFIPFRVTEIEKKLFITKVLCESDIKEGSQISSINNKKASEILKIIESKIPTDKGVNSKKTRSIDILFSYYYTLYIENTNKFELEIIEPNGNKIHRIIDAILWDNKNMFHSPREYSSSRSPINFKIENNIADLSIRTFGTRNFKNNNIDFQDTIAKIFQELSEKNINNLIIDLRGNNGGSLYFGELLFSYLTTKDTKYYKNNVMNTDIAEGNFKYAELPCFLDMFEKELGPLEKENGQYIIPRDTIKTNKPHFSGKIFFLTDGLSFSATSNFLAVCKNNNIGTVIGETPGGAYSGCNGGGPVTITLPNTDYRLSFNIIGILLNVNDSTNQINVDYKVSSEISNLIEDNIDIQKEFVINLIKKQK